jgi:uncharacterized protein
MTSGHVTRIDARAAEAIAIGAGILGTGGGGNPYLGLLMTREMLRRGANISLVDVADVPDEAVVCGIGAMGAPTVGIEKLPRGDEPLAALRALESHAGRRVTHLIAGEVGGANAMQPLIQSAFSGLPAVDGDGMGRAFPELQHCTFSIGGIACTPAAIADCHHNTTVFPRLRDTVTLERFARAVTVQMGARAGYAFPLMSGAEMRRTAVRGSYTLARAIGEAVLTARDRHADPVATILGSTDGTLLFAGRIADVERRLVAGFARGTLRLNGSGQFAGTQAEIAFQNENLIAWTGAGRERVLATVPDLISLVDEQTGDPVTTEMVRFGLRVAVLGMPAPAQLKTAAALAVVGPAAFGYDVPYRALPGVYGGALLLVI